MRMTREGLELIRSFEKCELVAYKDVGNKWTLGWGRARGIVPGQTCTQEEADAWFIADVSEFGNIVWNLLNFDGVHLTDNQFSAVVSFAYNVGLGMKGVKDGFMELESGGPSTMLRCLLEGNTDAAADEFPKWNKVAGVPCAGIIRRRAAEAALFLRADAVDGPS